MRTWIRNGSMAHWISDQMKERMKISSSYPVHPLLKKHIRYIYFIKRDLPDSSFNFYAFPNIGAGITLHHRSESKAFKNQIIVEESKQDYEMKLKAMRKEAVLMKLNGRIDEVTIVFEPLGINQFLSSPLNQICLGHDLSNIPLPPDDDQLHFCEQLFSAKSVKKRTAIIERYLMSRYNAFSHPVLEKAVALILHSKGEIKIAEIVKSLPVSTKAMEHLFIKHLNITPVTFRTIVRFRCALNTKIKEPKKKSTELAYGSSFYDQAHFINVFKKMTGKNPNRFFKTMQAVADKNYIIEPIG
jgi:AraC-like DNA-binding protein